MPTSETSLCMLLNSHKRLYQRRMPIIAYKVTDVDDGITHDYCILTAKTLGNNFGGTSFLLSLHLATTIRPSIPSTWCRAIKTHARDANTLARVEFEKRVENEGGIGSV